MVAPAESTAPIRPSQLTANPLIQHGRVALNPAPDRDVVDGETALGHHFLQIPVAERIPQYHRSREGSPRLGSVDHGTVPAAFDSQVTVADRRIPFATEPVDPVNLTASGLFDNAVRAAHIVVGGLGNYAEGHHRAASSSD
jgi:hypothetical protein